MQMQGGRGGGGMLARSVLRPRVRFIQMASAVLFLFLTNGILSRAITVETMLPGKRSLSL